MSIKGAVFSAAVFFGSRWLMKKQTAEAGPVPGPLPGQPGVPPPAPPGAAWPAPANLPPVPNVADGPWDLRVNPLDDAFIDIAEQLRGPAAAPPWLVYATAEMADGLRWPPSRNGFPLAPMGLTKRHVFDALAVVGKVPGQADFDAVASNPAANILTAGILLKSLYDRASALVRAHPQGGELEDVAHLVRIAWLDGAVAFDKILAHRDAPAWYMAAGPNGLSQASAWDRVFRRWSGAQQR